MDGSSTKDGRGAGVIIENPRGKRYKYALKFILKAPHNEVEYKAQIAKIELCYTTGADLVQAFSDSQLIVSQLNGEHEMKDDTMAAYVLWAREATRLLKHFSITYISRSGIDKPTHFLS